MEESILVSSDSESKSPPAVLDYNDDLGFPKTKLRDICGSDAGSLKTSTIKTYNAEPIASTSKYIPLTSDVGSRDGSRPSTSGTTKNRAGAGSYVHGVSDSDTSLTDFLSDSDDEPTANHLSGKTNCKPAGDRGQTNDTVGDKWIALLDEDTDPPLSRSSSTLPPDPVPDDDPILSASSSATLPPPEPSSFLYTLEKKPSFHDLSDSDGSSNMGEPTTISDIRSRDSWYPHVGDVGLSNARPEPPFHDDKPSDRISPQSEDILSNSISISEFVSQLETDSQPIAVSSQSSGSQKRPKSNINDVYERKRLKELKMKEKSERAAAAEKVRRMKPGECMKYVTVVLDQNIITEYTWGKDVIEILTMAGIKHSVEVSTDPCIVKWTREQADELVPHQEKHVLFLWSTDKLLTSVQFGSLSDTFADFKKKYENFKLYLCVYGLQNYYRKYRSSMKKTQNNCADPPRRKRKSNYEITPDNLEMELIALQIKFGISHKILNSPQDVAFFLQVMTKSVAEMPFKLEKEKIEMERNWYAKGDSKKCVRIDKDFNGLRQLWLQQLSQFNLSSLDIAKSIAELYPTPLSLYKAYQLCGSNERERMLQDIVVKRGPGGGGRRLGPELSRKISLMFCQNEDVSLGCTLEKIGSLLYS